MFNPSDLENVGLKIDARWTANLSGLQVVALVGPSGGGKSSIVKLIERFYLPAAGRVLLDGRDIGLYDPHWLKRRVALVSQEPVLYARRSAAASTTLFEVSQSV